MPPVLNETISNHSGDIPSNHNYPTDSNDYIYDMIFIKTKKAINTNVQRNKRFIQKSVETHDANKESPKLKNVNNVVKNDLECHKK